jgi:2C-methyl-D-erythritol 2,4-cyclodiphosphate synthase
LSAETPNEVERLRAILDRQPSCLMRVATDGTLLAVSDAGLGLLGASDLGQVLDSSLVDRLRGDTIAELWSDFVARVSQGGKASAETELEDLTGARRAVILQGIVFPDHPDGVPSLLLTVRDVSSARRLEASLEEEERLRRSLQVSLTDATATVEQLRKNLVSIATERKDLQAALATVLLQRPNIAQSVEQLRNALTAIMEAAAVARPEDKGAK